MKTVILPEENGFSTEDSLLSSGESSFSEGLRGFNLSPLPAQQRLQFYKARIDVKTKSQ